MKQKLEDIQRMALAEIDAAGDLKNLDDTRVKYLGRKGALTDILRGLAHVTPEERPVLGQLANDVKDIISTRIEARLRVLEEQASAQKTQSDSLDLSLPGRRPRKGHLHLVSQITEEVVDIFTELGFQVASGPEIETEYYNFDSLNISPDHPARDSHDTFHVRPGIVLRTHTSPVQMRVMEKMPPPVAVVVPGKVYRVDYDASHSPMFNQVEALLVDKQVSFADLKGTLLFLAHRLFGKNTKVRFRPSFFPFTEPSAEIDISCTVCGGSGCRVCKNSGWLEIGGCGMVHPEVFRYAKYDYENFTGYALGMGLDRIAMLKHRVNNIHLFFENDVRFLEQF